MSSMPSLTNTATKRSGKKRTDSGRSVSLSVSPVKAPAKYNEHACDLCGSKEATLLPHCLEYTNNEAVNICNACGFVYVPRRRSFTDIAKAWSEEIYSTSCTEELYTA